MSKTINKIFLVIFLLFFTIFLIFVSAILGYYFGESRGEENIKEEVKNEKTEEISRLKTQFESEKSEINRIHKEKEALLRERIEDLEKRVDSNTLKNQ